MYAEPLANLKSLRLSALTIVVIVTLGRVLPFSLLVVFPHSFSPAKEYISTLTHFAGGL